MSNVVERETVKCPEAGPKQVNAVENAATGQPGNARLAGGTWLQDCSGFCTTAHGEGNPQRMAFAIQEVKVKAHNAPAYDQVGIDFLKLVAEGKHQSAFILEVTQSVPVARLIFRRTNHEDAGLWFLMHCPHGGTSNRIGLIGVSAGFNVQ